MALLEVKNIYKSFGGVKAIQNFSIEANAGEIHGIIGPNGAGKTTIFNTISGVYTADQGTVVLDGKDITKLEQYKITRLGMGRTFQNIRLFKGLTVEENVMCAFDPQSRYSIVGGLLPTPKRRAEEKRGRELCEKYLTVVGMQDYLHERPENLSYGMQRRIEIARALMCEPKILLLDEPAAGLNPTEVGELTELIQCISKEIGFGILLIEHRLEEAIPLANKLLAIDDGRLIANDAVRPAVRALQGHPALSSAMPVAARVAGMWQLPDCPLTVQEGRRMLENQPLRKDMPVFGTESALNTPPALEMRDVFFRYERNLPDVLRGLSLTVRTGEIFCLLGGNGSGKSTALACAAKLLRPYAGTISVFGKKLKNYAGQSLYQNCLALLPQDVQTLFLCSTVAEELQSVHADTANFPMNFTPLLNRHPYDLSGGEQQALALFKALAARPRLLLLDEPTKGLDACARERMTALLQALRAQGLTVLCVTHDVAFAAACADRCALFFRGEVVSCEEPHAFFAGNHYYTTAANRMARGVCDTAICAEEVAALRRPPEAQP